MTMGGAMILLSAAGLAVAGCSSDGGLTSDGGDGGPTGDGGDLGPTATCGNVQACGGEVLGNWTFVEVCQSSASLAELAANFSIGASQSWCPSQTLVGIEPEASGSLSFDAAGLYSLTLVYGGYLNINLPASCLAGTTCDDATAGLQAQIDSGTYSMPNVSSISCSGSSGCLCRATVNSPRYEAGTYSIADGVLSFALATGAVSDKSYCVEGSKLHILDTSMRSPGQTEIDRDLVAMKQ